MELKNVSCLVLSGIMTSTDFDNNDKLAVENREVRVSHAKNDADGCIRHYGQSCPNYSRDLLRPRRQLLQKASGLFKEDHFAIKPFRSIKNQ